MPLKLIRVILVATFIGFLNLTASAYAKDCVASVDEAVRFRSGGNELFAERVVDYIAVIGARDLANSNGTRLADFRAIIQQDRANLHKSGKADIFDTTQDQSEQYFTTLKRRKMLSSARYYYDCFMSEKDIAALHKDVKSGNLSGVIWIVVFRHPDGNLAVYATLAG